MTKLFALPMSNGLYVYFMAIEDNKWAYTRPFAKETAPHLKLREEIVNWIDKTIEHPVEIGPDYLMFDNEADALMCYLTWH